MDIRIRGTAPDIVAAPVSGATAFFYRYEIVDGALIRRKVADTRPHAAGEVYLVDVLLNEDHTGRHIGIVRGIVVPERDLARIAFGDEPDWREFDVDTEIRSAIGRDLRVGPRPKGHLRLATIDGRRLDRDGD